MARRTLDDVVGAALDDEVEIDFSGAREGGDFDVLPAGNYDAVVESTDTGVSGSGNPKLVIRFKLENGRVQFKHCPLRGEGSGITRDVLTALGVDTEGMRKFNRKSIEGTPCVLVLGIQKDNPEFNEVKKVKPAAKRSVTGATPRKAAPVKKAAAKATAKKTTGARRLS